MKPIATSQSVTHALVQTARDIYSVVKAQVTDSTMHSLFVPSVFLFVKKNTIEKMSPVYLLKSFAILKIFSFVTENNELIASAEKAVGL